MRLSFTKPFLIFTFFIYLSCNSDTYAQIVNIEESRTGRDSSNYFAGKVGIDFSIFNQNAGKNQPNNYLQLTFDGDVAYNTPKHSYLLLNYFNYLLVNFNSENQRNTVAQQGYSHFRINLYRDRRLSYEFFTQAQLDKARGLDWRSLGGAYLRFRPMRHYQQVNVFLGTGFMHEHEEWRNPEQGNQLEISNLLKSTSYVSAKFKIQDYLEANAITYYQVGYSKAINRFRNRISGDISLGVKVTKVLSFKTGFNCTYEDAPIVPVTKFVYTLTNGFVVQF